MQPNENSQDHVVSDENKNIGYDPIALIHGYHSKFSSQAEEKEEKPQEEQSKEKAIEDVKDSKKDIKTEEVVVDIKKNEEKKQKQESNNNVVDNKEIETLKKRLSENQRFATKSNQAISNIKKLIAELVDEAAIDDEDAQKLLNSLKIEGVSFSESKVVENNENNFLEPIQKVLSKDIVDQYLEYSEDSNYAGKIVAFNAYYDELKEHEKKELVSEIMDEKTPGKILKKVLSFGEKMLSSEYGEIISEGGPKQYAIAQKKKIKKLEEENESLRKELGQYRDFDQNSGPVVDVANEKAINRASYSNGKDNNYTPFQINNKKKAELSRMVYGY